MNVQKISIVLVLALGVGSVVFVIMSRPPRNPQITNQAANTAEGIPNPKGTSAPVVPLPTGEDVILTFFNLIGEKKIQEAIGMMDEALAGNEGTKQQWGATFNSFDTVTVKSVEDYNRNTWSETSQAYRVVVGVTLTPSAQILWENGDNTRWITLAKNGALWKISEIATGP